MDYIQFIAFFKHLLSVNMLDSSFFTSGMQIADGFKILPDDFMGSAWSNFDKLVTKASVDGSTSAVYKSFMYLVLRVMSFMTFGFALYDIVQSLAGKGSAADNRGGVGKAVSKNVLIIIVAVLTFQAETVINGVWVFLKG